METYDVAIVGGGPAGLSAALMHGYLTRDGISPVKFRDFAKQDVEKYPNVSMVETRVERISRGERGFILENKDRSTAYAKKVLLATGLLDELPPVKGAARFFGRTVLPCPYCDGWEFRGKAIALYAKGEAALSLARAMRGWTNDLILCTDGPGALSQEHVKGLNAAGVRVREEKIKELTGEDDGCLRAIVFESGERLPREALFFDMPTRQHSTLAQTLGCDLGEKDAVLCDATTLESNIPGLYVAGNTTKELLLAIVAAAQGATAATHINKALLREEIPF